MDVVQGQVAPDVAHVAVVREQIAHHRLRLTAVGALEVAVLDDGDRRVGGSAEWSRSSSTGAARSTIASDDPSKACTRSRTGSRAVARNSSHAHSEDTTAALSTPSLAS